MSSPAVPEDTPAWGLFLVSQIKHLQTTVDSLKESIDTLSTRTTRVEENQTYLNQKMSSLQLLQVHRDSHEVRISGIPRVFTSDEATMLKAAEQVFLAMKCSKAIPYMYSARIFETKGQDSETTVSAMIVVQFSSSVARDDVIKSGKHLKDFTARKLFGVGEEVGIYVNPILPPPIHKLSAASRKRAREINYPPPPTCSTISRFYAAFFH